MLAEIFFIVLYYFSIELFIKLYLYFDVETLPFIIPEILRKFLYYYKFYYILNNILPS